MIKLYRGVASVEKTAATNSKINALLLLVSRFCTYFSFQTLQFFVGGSAKILFTQGAGYPSYVTV